MSVSVSGKLLDVTKYKKDYETEQAKSDQLQSEANSLSGKIDTQTQVVSEKKSSLSANEALLNGFRVTEAPDPNNEKYQMEVQNEDGTVTKQLNKKAFDDAKAEFEKYTALMQQVEQQKKELKAEEQKLADLQSKASQTEREISAQNPITDNAKQEYDNAQAEAQKIQDATVDSADRDDNFDLNSDEMNDLLGEQNGDVADKKKVSKRKADLSEVKGGLEESAIKDDKKNLAMFKAMDKDGNGVLDEDEINNFKQSYDKNNDGVASRKDARKFIKENNLKDQDIKKKDVVNFLKQFDKNTENVESTEKNEDGTVTLKYKDGLKKTVNQDRSYQTQIKLNQGKDNETEVTKSFTADNVLKSEKSANKNEVKEISYAKDGKTPATEKIQDLKNGVTTDVTYDEKGLKSKLVETSKDSVKTVDFEEGKPTKSVETSKDSVTTIDYKDGKPSSKEVSKNDGKEVSKFEFTADGNERITSKKENIGDKNLEKTTVYEYNEDGSYIEKSSQPGQKTETATLYNANGKKVQQQKIVDGKKYEANYDGNGNTEVVLQNGESLAALAKKCGCSVDDIKKLNPDAKGHVGEKLKVPGEFEADKPELKDRKSSEESIAAYKQDQEIKAQKREQAKAEKEYYQKLGVTNFNNKGQKVKADGWGDKEFEVVGDVGYGRQLVKLNGKLYTRSHDGKILRDDYLQAHKAFVNKPKEQRNNTVSGQKDVTYVKDQNGKVWYFDEKTGKAIVKNDYNKIVQKESAYVANQLHEAAKGMGTDEELLEKGVKNIYSREILQGVNAQLEAKDSDYKADDKHMAVEKLILDEMSHSAARPLFKTLLNNGTMTTEEKARTIARELENEVTGYTSTSDINEIMQLCDDRDVRVEIEAQIKKNHPELKENDGSYVRAYLDDDGWNEQEVDQFDANWIKTGAYKEAVYVYKTDKDGNIEVDANGQPIVELLDEGDQAHRNAVVGRLVFDYNDKEALNKGLEAINDDPNSADYKYLDERAGQEIDKDTKGKYKSRFTNQNNVQRYLAGFHSDESGDVDVGNLSASNTLLYKGEKPARIQAEEALYDAQKGDYSKTFDSMESETYDAMAELIANGDIKNVKDIKDLYNKALKGADSENDKVKITANAMLSNHIEFSDEQITDFCVKMMHSIDSNRGAGGSTGKSASLTNDADYQTEQLKAILQNNPQVLAAVKARVDKEDFYYVTTVKTSASGVSVSSSCKTQTKDKYLEMLADTKNIAKEEIFLDENGNKITDENKIKALKENNSRALSEMRKYVAELERDFKKGVDAEGCLSDFANSISEHSGLGTDRGDVATEYRNAKLLLKQFEAAAQGKLRDSKGKVVSAQDLAKQVMDKQNKLAETNSDYAQTIAYTKMGIVLAPVIAVTTIASGGSAALGWGTLATGVVAGTAAGATTYGVNALEYGTSYTGDTAEAREKNLEDSVVNGATTAIGIGQMKYIGNLANDANTVIRTGVRLGATITSDVATDYAFQYLQNGDYDAEAGLMNLGMSVAGNVIGAKSLGEKHVKPQVDVDTNTRTGRNEIADAEVARNIDQSHLNANDRKMIESELDAQGTPTPAELEAYAKEHGYQALTPEQKTVLDKYHAENAKAYAEAHTLENNATITEQKAPKPEVTADEAAVKQLENEIKGIDGNISTLNRKIFNAKKMGKNTSELETQLGNLQNKRAAKAAELDAATGKGKVEPKPDAEVKPKADADAEVKTDADAETKVKTDAENITSAANAVDSAGIPAQYQSLWTDCKEKISSLMHEISMPSIANPKELLQKGKNLLGKLKTVIDNVTNFSLKSEIQSVYDNLKNKLSKLSASGNNGIKEITSDKQAVKLHEKLIKNRFIGESGNNSDVVFLSPNGWMQASYKYPTASPGTQWKMHIYSDSPQEWAKAAQIAMPYLEENGVLFKTVADLDNHLQLLRDTAGQKGKAFTIYFKDEEQFLNVAQGLEARFKESGLTSSGKVANEAQIGDSGFLSYRHEGAERGTVYKPDNVEDPFLKKFGSQSSLEPDANVSAKGVEDVSTQGVVDSKSQSTFNDISNDMNRARTPDDLVSIEKKLSEMPDCKEKRTLQAQIESLNKDLSVSTEVRKLFSERSISKISDLREGQATVLAKNEYRYIVRKEHGQIRLIGKEGDVNFDIPMSNRTPVGQQNPGKSMNEVMSPQSKRIYRESYGAFLDSKNKTIIHNATDMLTENNLLHGTSLEALLSEGGILDKGLVPRELSGRSTAKFADGSSADTLTPLCTDVWDIRQASSIEDYFDARSSHWTNRGESNFLSSSIQMRSAVTIVLDKNSMHPDILKNSFNVNQTGRSRLIQDGCIGGIGDGIHDYPTHRAIPVGAPANSIDRIIVDTRRLSPQDVLKLKKKISANNLSIKIFDMHGRQL